MDDIIFFGVCFPQLLLLLVLSAGLFFIADWLFARFGGYAHVWHPGLFRVAAFIALFSLNGLAIIC